VRICIILVAQTRSFFRTRLVAYFWLGCVHGVYPVRHSCDVLAVQVQVAGNGVCTMTLGALFRTARRRARSRRAD
jgi:hypothetical protein